MTKRDTKTVKKVRVYRLENQAGNGVFSVGQAATYLLRQSKRFQDHSPYYMPCPHSEKELGSELNQVFEAEKGSDLVFGFLTKKQIKSAFPCAWGRKAINFNGIQISVYEVPEKHLVRGFHQVAFKAYEAQFVGTLNPSTLKEEKDNYNPVYGWFVN